MKFVHVPASHPYDVCIGSGILPQLGTQLAALHKSCTVAVISDDTVFPLYGEAVCDSLRCAGFRVVHHVIPSGESAKNLTTYGEVLTFLAENRLTRTDLLLALGGGVVGDLAGFAAATLLRGVAFVQMPTTLLAQVDSSVGGKVAIDLPAGKNLAGAFWQPKLVLMDPDCLSTLSDKTFSDGMAEVIKYGCIRDRAFFDFLGQCAGRAGVMAQIEQVLYTCCDIKRQVVLADERDTGLRMLLNFGHTVGHAFELAGRYEDWTHGQAVAAGMVWAVRLGEKLGITPAGVQDAVQTILKQYDLPVRIACPWQTMVEAVGLDKKRAEGGISFVLLDKLGWAVCRQMKNDRLLDELKRLYEETV